MMVPGMGAKISVLIQISFAWFVCMIEQVVDVMSGKQQPAFHQTGCFRLFSILYLMKILKSSVYICRWMQLCAKPIPVKT
jgi:hypothetical protein